MNTRAQEIFEAAMELPPEAWDEFVHRSCGGDEELRREVMSLIDAHRQAGDFLLSPTGPVIGPPEPANAADAETCLTPGGQAPDGAETQLAPAGQAREGPGARIGPYRILEQIGEGGFGSVFLAEQQTPIQRRVALKIIKLGMDTKQVIARFEQERQALALMDHPNIAAVLDAGSTESGRPYFVMELVKGEPLTRYCDRYNLSIEDRLRLFVQVCEAVQHAHQKGVIHRDIKPSNIMASTRDGRAFVKIIDFGIAKAMTRPLTDRTLFTEHHVRIGTPEYMSPEHAEGSLDIDTRSDVYSLGVLLYELLTGETPFDSQQLRAAGVGEMQRIICEEEPLNPSRRLSTLSDPEAAAGRGPGPGSAIAVIAKRRRTDPKSLLRFVRGELDWIVMKCLEKDRARRYETAKALADDIERHLADEPVVAGPPSARYKARKFMRRHRAGVLAASLIAAALILGLGGTAGALVLRTRERDRAVRAQDAAIMSTQQFGGALTALVASTRGSIASESAVDPLLELDKWLDGAELSRLPSVEMEVRQTLALCFESLNRPEKAKEMLASMDSISRRQNWSAAETETIRAAALARQVESIMVLADLRGETSDWDNARSLVTRAMESLEQAGGASTLGYAKLRMSLGSSLLSQNRYDEALPILREVVDFFSAASPLNDELLGEAQQHLSTATWLSRPSNETRADQAARLEQAAQLASSAVERLQKAYPTGHRKIADAKGWLAGVDALRTRDSSKVIATLREASDALGPSTRERLARVRLLNRIAYEHLRAKAYALARDVAQDAASIGDALFAEPNTVVCQSHFVLAVAYEQLGDKAGAEREYQYMRGITAGHPRWMDEVVRNPRSKLAELMVEQGRYRESQEVMSEVVRLDAGTKRIEHRLQSSWRLLLAMGVQVDPPANQPGRPASKRPAADSAAIARSFENERDRLHAWVLGEDVRQTLKGLGPKSPEGAARERLLRKIREANTLLAAAFAEAPAGESTDLVAPLRTLADELCEPWISLDESEGKAAAAEWDRRFAESSKSAGTSSDDPP